jgi:hypothetical protein
MRKLPFIFILLTSFSSSLWSQFSRLKEINASSDFFSIDYKSNIYFTEGDSLFKSEPPYQNKFSYYFGKQAPNYRIDVSNPSQILLFFPELQKIIFLDSTLRENNRSLYLDEIGMLDISLVSFSPKNRFWLYNQSDNSLSGLNAMYLPIAKTINLDGFFNYPKKPSYLYTDNDKLYLNVPSYGILIMSDLGRFMTFVNLPGLVDFQVLGHDLIFYRDGNIFLYNIRKQNTLTIPLPDVPDIINALYSTNRIFLQTRDKILIFRYQ